MKRALAGIEISVLATMWSQSLFIAGAVRVQPGSIEIALVPYAETCTVFDFEVRRLDDYTRRR